MQTAWTEYKLETRLWYVLLVRHGAKLRYTHEPLLLLLVVPANEVNVDVVQILLDAHTDTDCRENIRAILDKDTEPH